MKILQLLPLVMRGGVGLKSLNSSLSRPMV